MPILAANLSPSATIVDRTGAHGGLMEVLIIATGEAGVGLKPDLKVGPTGALPDARAKARAHVPFDPRTLRPRFL